MARTKNDSDKGVAAKAAVKQNYKNPATMKSLKEMEEHVLSNYVSVHIPECVNAAGETVRDLNNAQIHVSILMILPPPRHSPHLQTR